MATFWGQTFRGERIEIGNELFCKQILHQLRNKFSVDITARNRSGDLDVRSLSSWWISPQDFPPRRALSWGKNERCCGKTDPQDGLASWGRAFAPPRQSSLGVGHRSPPRLPAFRERAARGKKARLHALGAVHIAHAQGPAATERPIDLHSP